MKTLLRALLVVATLSLTAVACSASQPQPVELSPDSPMAQGAWQMALHLAKAPPTWVVPQHIVVFKFSHPELWGQTFFYHGVDSLGNVSFEEQVIIYGTSENNDLLVRNVLIHEFLHCIHVRLSIMDPAHRNDGDDEQYVCGLGACPRDPRTAHVGTDDPEAPSEPPPVVLQLLAP